MNHDTTTNIIANRIMDLRNESYNSAKCSIALKNLYSNYPYPAANLLNVLNTIKLKILQNSKLNTYNKFEL